MFAAACQPVNIAATAADAHRSTDAAAAGATAATAIIAARATVVGHTEHHHIIQRANALGRYTRPERLDLSEQPLICQRHLLLQRCEPFALASILFPLPAHRHADVCTAALQCRGPI